MACGATLKRSLEFDPVHSPSPRSNKRRRCIPMTVSPSTPSSRSNSSPFGEVYPKMTGDSENEHDDRHLNHVGVMTSTEQIAANISAEIRRMQRRRQIQFPGNPGSPSQMSQSGSGSDSGSPSPPPEMSHGTEASPSQQRFFNALSPSKKDIPLFTFRHVGMVCERMLKEREEQIREEYDKVLTCKLAEQYEAFLKFNHDQIHRRFTDSTASYVS